MGVNRLLNPNLEANGNLLSGWTRSQSATLSLDSRTQDGTASVQLTQPYSFENRFISGNLLSHRFEVTTGSNLTLSLFMKSTNGPTYISVTFKSYDLNGIFIENNRENNFGNSQDGVWEEVVAAYTPKSGAKYIAVSITKKEDTQSGGKVQVDDFYLTDSGIGFVSPPTNKNSFDGEHVKVDSLGNITILRNNQWKRFFPFCVYSSGNRVLAQGFEFYSNQGWNCNPWASGIDTVEKARRAISRFNPDGMMSGIDLSGYVMRKHAYFNNTAQLEQRLREIKNRGLMDQLLFYYLDNENNWEEINAHRSVVQALRNFDRGASGRFQNPIYILQGQFGTARTYDFLGLSDMMGTYFNGYSFNTDPGGFKNNITIAQNLGGNKSPFSMAQFNGVDGAGEMRSRLYDAIINGAKGFGYWRDCYMEPSPSPCDSVLPIDQQAWWNDIPNLRNEVDNMQDLIATPHWTGWQVKALPENILHIGTRNLNGKAYLIVRNTSTADQNIQIEVLNAPYKVRQVRDYFSGAIVGEVINDKFRLLIAGIYLNQGTAVLSLEP
jgi:hypothetical protein